ncbi:phenylalanine ammonia-lyase [Lepidopterella palustris CBS 459.81]|uniref:Phenylalanine ammonia-lyase n=1 Tax=Lepidopterella palustris CBS 459.81 TaxID=1314670 RepID=A0A8E2EI23_9PEZI|nr:phenylalanine ammonia-lyase [Lepidopterella palustris CBS 459.81]
MIFNPSVDMEFSSGPLPNSATGRPVDQSGHGLLVVSEWDRLQKQLHERNPILIDGSSLDISSVTAVSRYGFRGALSRHPAVIARIEESVNFLDTYLAQGHTVYGINTGFGGSADVRTDDHHLLQRSLLQMQQSGVLPVMDQNFNNGCRSFPSSSWQFEAFAALSMPTEWVRGTMLVRCNSLVRGHSAVRPEIIDYLMKLLEHDVIPLVPLRGSISASGDLSPLSYLAGALEGNPDTYVWMGDRYGSEYSRRPVPSSEALAILQLEPIAFRPKEALALVNGTAVSAAVSSLALHDLHNLLALSQVLTAMGVEAILGTAESFAPFISNIRPHRGQTEVAHTILSCLNGSELASGIVGSHSASAAGLFQDRYSIRTVPQWLGPFLEDLLLAHEQIVTECNSTTDNPLIDSHTGSVYHGGNFQAVSATSAMEKARLAAQAIGRMIFAQSTELLNPVTNRGLSPSLCADEPSTSFTMKGVDINMAAYMSELSFLGNPVHNHVQNAEMGNQALNSLALVSARYTHTAIELLSLMSASYLYVLCQALDLRVRHIHFIRALQPALENIASDIFSHIAVLELNELHGSIWTYVNHEMMKTTTLDTPERFDKIMTGAQTAILTFFQTARSPKKDDMLWRKDSVTSPLDLPTSLHHFRTRATTTAIELFNQTRDEYLMSGDASAFLGTASKRMYRFVRKELKVPMNWGIVDHPTPYPGTGAATSICTSGDGNRIADTASLPETAVPISPRTNGIVNRLEDPASVSETLAGAPLPTNSVSSGQERVKKTTGSWISIIYEALRDGRLISIVVDCLKEVVEHPGVVDMSGEGVQIGESVCLVENGGVGVLENGEVGM